MPIEVISTIKPKNAGLFAIVEDGDLKGSYRAVADATERDAIPAERRKEGMMVYQIDIDSFLRLDGSDSWAVVPVGRHEVVADGSYMPMRGGIYFKGMGGEDEPIDDYTIVSFPRQVSTAERLALGDTWPGRTVFDTDLNQLATYDGTAWRLL